MEDEEYLVVNPRTPIAGCLAVVVKKSKYQTLADIEQSSIRHRFIARAYLSDHVPLHGSINEIMSRAQFHCIKLNETPLSIFLHHGGENAVYYDFCSGEDGFLEFIEVEIDAELPSSAFSPARTAVNELIDSIQRGQSIPLVIVRIDLLLKEENEPFAHQLILPYPVSLNMGPLGGIYQYPDFSSYESVLREAIISSSPYYRLLCAYRLYEGLNKLKMWLKTISKEIGVNEKLPKDPKIDKKLLSELGFDMDKFSSVSNMNDLWNQFTDLRNQVAHFFTKNAEYSLHLSHGQTYYEYSLSAAILLHYSNITFSNLSQYFNKYLSGKLAACSILPMKECRDKFVIRL
ncbi:MAG: hypothetical protein L3J75_06690 [Methylococcaceae bacterium]|nr:hypothetical protein [Methylococcaceae bacterium]